MGCPAVEQGAIGTWIDEHKVIVGPALIALGIVMTFFGHIFMQALTVLFIFGAVSFSVAYGGLMLLDKIDMSDNTIAIWGTLGVAVLLGLCLGCALKNFIRTGMSIIGGVGGGALGVILTQVFMIHNETIHTVTVFGCALAGCILGYWISKGIIVIASAFIGSYMTVRGISLFAGGYPNEFTLAQMIKIGHITWDNFPKIFFAYLGGMLVLTLIGIWFQSKNRKKESNQSNSNG